MQDEQSQTIFSSNRINISADEGIDTKTEPIYSNVVEKLTDYSDHVRLQAIDQLWHFYKSHPEQLIYQKTVSGQLTRRLTDDVFVLLCGTMHDSNLSVRIRAMSVLGTLYPITPHILAMAFSREPVGLTREHEIINQLPARFRSHSWRWSRPINQNIGSVDIVEKGIDLNVASKGSTGVFVDGLEDEHDSVRNATIDTVCELSLRNPIIARDAVDSLIAMFTDESAEVRMNTARSLQRMGEVVTLDQNQLKAAFGLLHDRSQPTRETLYRFFTGIDLPDAHCLHATITALLENITAFEEDIESIFQCLAGIGKRNSDFVQLIALDVLKVDTRFAALEPLAHDPCYIGILVLLSNAALEQPKIYSLLPSFCSDHLRSLRDRMPLLIPSLEKTSTVSMTVSTGLIIDRLIEMENALQRELTRTRKKKILVQFLRNLESFSFLEYDSSLKDLREFCTLYLNVHLSYLNWIGGSETEKHHAAWTITHSMDTILSLFVGLSHHGRSYLLVMRAIGMAMISLIQPTGNTTLEQATEDLNKGIRTANSYISQHGVNRALLPEQGSFGEFIMGFEFIPVTQIIGQCKIRRITATIDEIKSLDKKPFELLKGFPAVFPVCAVVKGVFDVGSICVRIKATQPHTRVPLIDSWSPLGPLKWKLQDKCTFVPSTITNGKFDMIGIELVIHDYEVGHDVVIDSVKIKIKVK